MPKFPYFGFPNPYYRNYRYYPNYNYQTANSTSTTSKVAHQSLPSQKEETKKATTSQEKSRSNPKEDAFLDIFGLKLYFDDILLVALLFFLYNEGVKDEGLFLALVMLLLT